MTMDFICKNYESLLQNKGIFGLLFFCHFVLVLLADDKALFTLNWAEQLGRCASFFCSAVYLIVVI